MVNYLSWVALEDGIITATRPDGGYWGERVKAGGNKAWLRLGDNTYKMQAEQITGAQHLDMMGQWAAKSGRTLDEALYEGSEPLREWEVFFGRPNSKQVSSSPTKKGSSVSCLFCWRADDQLTGLPSYTQFHRRTFRPSSARRRPRSRTGQD